MPKPLLGWGMLILAVIALDQTSKHAMIVAFEYGEIRSVIPGFFNLTLLYNPGAAFSFLAKAGGWQRYVLTGIAVVASVIMLYLLKKYEKQFCFCLALSLIIGGGISNAIDRVLLGYVVDFIQIYYKTWYYPVFNLADSAICLGIVFMLGEHFGHRRKKK